MQFVRSTLAQKREGLDVGEAIAAAGSPGIERQSSNPAIGQPGPPGCQAARSPDCHVVWSPEAEQRLQRVPEFIRPMARQGIERFAADRGYQRITEDVMDEARGALGL
jgi:hypothetical protein